MDLQRVIGIILGLYRDSEQKMEATIVCWGYIGFRSGYKPLLWFEIRRHLWLESAGGSGSWTRAFNASPMPNQP